MQHLDAWTLAPTALSAAILAFEHLVFHLGLPRRAEPPTTELTASVLKPLCGDDDELAENLASFSRSEGVCFELLLGVASADDPAFAVARAFVAAHPELDARIVLTGSTRALNPKVAQLLALEREARGEVLVISDSNVRAGPRDLAALVGAFSDPRLGVASNLVLGRGERTLGAALENLQLTASVAPGVQATWSLLGVALTIGKSMALRRETLRDLGGFASVADVLAEDYVLGRRARARGWGVRVLPRPVENRNVSCGLERTVSRHTRWAQLRRSLVPSLFAAEIVRMPLAVALLALVCRPTASALAGLGAVTALQVLLTFGALCRLRGLGAAVRLSPLEPLRALAIFACWVRAAASRVVLWRGTPMVLGEGSRLSPWEPGRRPRRGRN
jgi:ceramide glucosyltransferase